MKCGTYHTLHSGTVWYSSMVLLGATAVGHIAVATVLLLLLFAGTNCVLLRPKGGVLYELFFELGCCCSMIV